VNLKRGIEHTLTLVLEHGANVDARDNDGDTPLIWASTEGHVGLVTMLLDAGAHVNNSGSVCVDFEPHFLITSTVIYRRATPPSLGRRSMKIVISRSS
jgi:ankyrin repeat protein